jgi:sialidase-1
LVRHNPPTVEYPRNCKECGELNRSHLTAYLSDDDGSSWTGGLLLDDRATVSYPDGTEDADGTIFITYDRDRRSAREILLSSFHEEHVIIGTVHYWYMPTSEF